jgi:protein gp37
MATTSKIEWTEQTWNPVTGCTKISPGCKNCYAETMAKRLKAMGASGYKSGFKLALQQDRLEQPLRRSKPTVWFVNSMSDLFHEDVPDGYLDAVFQTIRQTPQHTYQVLTKRADRLPIYFASRTVPGNVWLGVSVENRKHGKPRIEHLRNVSARIRFLSVEPLLEDLGDLDLTNIHWVIVGGESGSKARPMKPQWARRVQQQCEDAHVAYFFKQWGTWGADGRKRTKHANGRELDGQLWNQYPLHSQPHHSASEFQG